MYIMLNSLYEAGGPQQDSSCDWLNMKPKAPEHLSCGEFESQI
jgi:hypothetical protein